MSGKQDNFLSKFLGLKQKEQASFKLLKCVYIYIEFCCCCLAGSVMSDSSTTP